MDRWKAALKSVAKLLLLGKARSPLEKVEVAATLDKERRKWGENGPWW